jgi:hypothetical protein
MTGVAGNTTPGFHYLEGARIAAGWVKGDGSAKTLTLHLVSDSGNVRSTDWNDDELFMLAFAPDDAGGSKFDIISTQGNLLATPSAVTDDTVSVWGAGTQNPQKLVASIAPDYEGPVWAVVFFAPGANADSIYVDGVGIVT